MKKVLFIMIIVLMLFLNGCSSKTNQYCVAYEGKGSLGYDDTYFNKKDLIILVVDKGNSFDYQICGIDIRDTYIDIIIKKLHKYGGFTDEAYAYLFLIEIEKQEQEEIILSIRDK